MVWNKYKGQTVEIVYLTADGRLTQRCIQVRQVSETTIRALCLQAREPRTFLINRILAYQPLARRAG